MTIKIAIVVCSTLFSVFATSRQNPRFSNANQHNKARPINTRTRRSSRHRHDNHERPKVDQHKTHRSHKSHNYQDKSHKNKSKKDKNDKNECPAGYTNNVEFNTCIVVVPNAIATYDFSWTPNTQYLPNLQNDFVSSSWWRCGSGAFVVGTGASAVCDTGSEPLDPNNFRTTGDSCQTIGDYGARTVGAGGIRWTATYPAGSGTLVNQIPYNGESYLAVLALFETEYCTGPWTEYFAQDNTNVPRDSDGQPPGSKFIKSWRLYLKVSNTIPTGIPDKIGIKMIISPYFNLFPLDQTNCDDCGQPICDFKFTYTPWICEDPNPNCEQAWPGQDCVSSDDRVSCFDIDEEKDYAAVAGFGGDAFGCLDFAGCGICNIPGPDPLDPSGPCLASKCAPNLVPAPYCVNSPVVNLNAYPLGSFFYNIYLTTEADDIAFPDASFCGDSVSLDDGKTYQICTPNSPIQKKYENYCVATRFYNCQDHPAFCSAPNTCPDDVNQAEYSYTFTSFDDLCQGGISGECTNSGTAPPDPETDVVCAKEIFNKGTDEVIDVFPLKITCWVTKVVLCTNVKGQW